MVLEGAQMQKCFPLNSSLSQEFDRLFFPTFTVDDTSYDDAMEEFRGNGQDFEYSPDWEGASLTSESGGPSWRQRPRRGGRPRVLRSQQPQPQQPLPPPPPSPQPQLQPPPTVPQRATPATAASSTPHFLLPIASSAGAALTSAAFAWALQQPTLPGFAAVTAAGVAIGGTVTPPQRKPHHQQKASGGVGWFGCCVFCRNNGEDEDFYKNHVLKDRQGRVQCPILRAYTCPNCGASGDRAHTLKYCPLGSKTAASMAFAAASAAFQWQKELLKNSSSFAPLAVAAPATSALVAPNVGQERAIPIRGMWSSSISTGFDSCTVSSGSISESVSGSVSISRPASVSVSVGGFPTSSGSVSSFAAAASESILGYISGTGSPHIPGSGPGASSGKVSSTVAETGSGINFGIDSGSGNVSAELRYGKEFHADVPRRSGGGRRRRTLQKYN